LRDVKKKHVPSVIPSQCHNQEHSHREQPHVIISTQPLKHPPRITHGFTRSSQATPKREREKNVSSRCNRASGGILPPLRCSRAQGSGGSIGEVSARGGEGGGGRRGCEWEKDGCARRHRGACVRCVVHRCTHLVPLLLSSFHSPPRFTGGGHFFFLASQSLRHTSPPCTHNNRLLRVLSSRRRAPPRIPSKVRAREGGRRERVTPTTNKTEKLPRIVILLTQTSPPKNSHQAGQQAVAAAQALFDTAASDPLDPTTAAKIAGVLGPFLSVSTVLFIVRIVMTWYPSVSDESTTAAEACELIIDSRK
jgi:hypothetical protein